MNAKDFEQYVRANFSRERKTTPGPEMGAPMRLLYVATAGLAGETGETIEHFKKWVRDGVVPGKECLLEMGDALHYFTVLAWAAGFTLEEIMAANKAKLDERFGRKGDTR